MPSPAPGPRPRATRIADTLTRLTTDHDCWLATAGTEGAWLVPLSFIWHDQRIVMATGSRSRVVSDVALRSRVRLAVGPTRDVVILDGTATTMPVSDIEDEVVQEFARKLSTDPREWAGTLVVVTPTRIQAWREENELEGREIMSAGVWLD
ncbi:MAG: pyridoxamine 5'-phosphate oxidase family protein [Euzebya sp.]